MLPVPKLFRRAPLAAGVVVVTVSALALSGCEAAQDAAENIPGVGASDDETTAVAETTPVQLKANVKRGATDVPVSTLVEVTAAHGELDKVTVTGGGAKLPGEISANGASWTATERLEPGVTYSVKATGTGEDGESARWTSEFTSQALTLDQQTYPSVAPLDGETVGVGMPVVVTFDLPVTDKKTIERNLHVETTPAQEGTWHWVTDNEVHYRPKKYWQAGTEVSVDVDINGVPAGGGLYGQEDRQIDFTVGDAHIYKVNAQTHQMEVFSNGKLLRTIPITTGKEGFTTRSGVKVIIEKFDVKRMNSETVGIPQGSAEAYDIDDVQWAMRLTYSGEFIHAAPWSVGSQGYANVSHGCTGMSTENAGWLYDMTLRGDVVEYVGTDRPMEPYNGYGDWNIDYADYRAGSALD
ncbi:lipoprotein-anchoring transpeptidase ErfK/SrfK [Nocardioides thalensis]|uniref:Lipoprotein-anchoring transpeptidase ErfK/SrfK n=1 Tax=Nocardioides thalensis TaxID=1914755 RepID=A0A853C4N0_9ACTN|nr:Ig-like domain-containing protein [Nocardioides thalensis]NYJ01966.1 lipoprotein-anchoring transpeptidase ErfK/SrfK [Nocardioides thalensis]